jgi:hypothetical protein
MDAIDCRGIGRYETDAHKIRALMTENPRYKTAEGIGPKTLLRQAAEVYGKPALSYHTENESREYVEFENPPSPMILFGTGNGQTNPAGIYLSPGREYNETWKYRSDALIESVSVIDGNSENNDP